MKGIVGKIVLAMPVATFLYVLLVMFAGLNFNIKWLVFAMALDIADWIIAEIT